MSTKEDILLKNDMKKLTALLLSVALLIPMLSVLPVSAGYNKAYRMGDADGNSVIDIVDATLIQKVVILNNADSDGLIVLRGDGNGDGLDVADATAVQRYTLNLKCGYSVGEWVYLEESTQAPTQKPTYDEYELPIA